MTSLLRDPVPRLVERVRRGECTARELTEEALARHEQCAPELRAFLHLDADCALRQAEAIDARIGRGDTEGALLGIPVAVKDNLCTADQPTTCASRILEGFRPSHDATVVARLREQGAIVLGKTNLDEFAMGASTENSGWFPSANPYDLTRVPGGSSGGSAVAVAAGVVPLALGSDTGGSVRQPAAFCGAVGLRPTYGAVSRFGLVAFASSLDQVGPLARSVPDLEHLFRVIEGPDPRDSTSLGHRLPDGGSENLRGRRVGVVDEYHGAGVDPAIEQALLRSCAKLEELGAELEPCSLPLTGYAVPTYYLLVTSEASSNLARFDGVRYGPRHATGGSLEEMYAATRAAGFGDEVKRRIMLGTFSLSAGYYDAYYKKALAARAQIRREFVQAFERFDFLIGATAPTCAFKLGEKQADPLLLYLCDVFTAPSSLAGIPSISLPAGLSEERLPIGIQMFGAHESDYRLLAAARLLEERLGRCPPPGDSSGD